MKSWMVSPESMAPGGRYRASPPVYATKRYIEERFGIEIMDWHGVTMAFDVVGRCDWREIEWYRPAGVLFRYFDDHHARLAEFQGRLDKAKQRRLER